MARDRSDRPKISDFRSAALLDTLVQQWLDTPWVPLEDLVVKMAQRHQEVMGQLTEVQKHVRPVKLVLPDPQSCGGEEKEENS